MSLTELFGREPSMTPEARVAELNEHDAKNERQFQRGLRFGTPMGMATAGMGAQKLVLSGHLPVPESGLPWIPQAEFVPVNLKATCTITVTLIQKGSPIDCEWDAYDDALLARYEAQQHDYSTKRGTPLTVDERAYASALWSARVSAKVAADEAARKAREPRVICQGDWIADEENF